METKQIRELCQMAFRVFLATLMFSNVSVFQFPFKFCSLAKLGQQKSVHKATGLYIHFINTFPLQHEQFRKEKG